MQWLSDCCSGLPIGEVDERHYYSDGEPVGKPYAIGFCRDCGNAATFHTDKEEEEEE